MNKSQFAKLSAILPLPNNQALKYFKLNTEYTCKTLNDTGVIEFIDDTTGETVRPTRHNVKYTGGQVNALFTIKVDTIIKGVKIQVQLNNMLNVFNKEKYKTCKLYFIVEDREVYPMFINHETGQRFKMVKGTHFSR